MAKPPEAPKLRLEADVAIATLVPNPRNPRRHPPAQLQKLAKSIKRFGQPRPILARAENRMIIAGHGLVLAMEEAKLAKGDVYWWDVSQDVADAYMLADNQHALNGRDDEAQLAILLEEVARDNYESLGFDDGLARELLEGGDEIEVREVATAPVKDRFWISVRGALKDQARALKAMREAMAPLGGVTVELGTVAEE